MRPLTGRLEDGYCSITIANHGLITVIIFVSKSYTHPWKGFTNKFRLLLHACIRLFVKIFSWCKPNTAIVGASEKMPVFPTCISEKPQTLDSPGDCGPVLEERAGEQLYTLHSLSDQKEAAGGLLFMQLCIIASQVRGFF